MPETRWSLVWRIRCADDSKAVAALGEVLEAFLGAAVCLRAPTR